MSTSSDSSNNRCGETAELDDRESIINTLLYLSQHAKRIREKERFWHEERTKTVR
jgi:hypothetical protein